MHGSLKMQGNNIFKPRRLIRTEQASLINRTATALDLDLENLVTEHSSSLSQKQRKTNKGVVPIPPVNTHRGSPNQSQWSGSTSEEVSSVVRPEAQTGE